MPRNIDTNHAREKYIENVSNRIYQYNINPKLCQHCQKPLPYKYHNLRTFCSSSCFVSNNNKRRIRIKKKPKPRFCPTCKQEVLSRFGTFCEPYGKCQSIYTMRIARIEKRKVSRETIRRYLILTRGQKCESCELSKWKDIKIPFETHHIDGNYKNNEEENLQLLCPNCHAITDNYRGKNRGNGRGEYKHQRR